MAIIRKRKILDGIDREILRCLKDERMVSQRIAKCVGRAPSSISPRLRNLETRGIIKKVRTQGIRNFNRSFGNKRVKISSPRSILWGLDMKKKRRK